ncbi:anion permease [Actinobacillus delphinicola]|uniref:Anion transporter n=1 Tax=Actinobacillus delphinicola TaxID=51161 RepID=A0A448TVP4_9PAST|nr:DASS family sodium-coupled anion symporter [Actinobacillus delphinicola]MDG6896528.1 anion permease [Actinobacillus delphinicola]VEJ10008.1 anion transporter [Actinobacillus delphinicola]
MLYKKEWLKALIPIIIGFIVFFIPQPESLSINAWIFTSIFAALIMALILEPAPPAFLGIIGVVIAVLFKVGPVGSGAINNATSAAQAIKWGLSGFSNTVVWLIFVAFMIGLGYKTSGFGHRLALFLVKKMGRTTLGLGYAISITDVILAPFIPSNAARSGGILYPMVTSIPPMFGSYPDKDAKKIGAYLAWTAYAATCVSSSIFLTGQAPNPLAVELAVKAGIPMVGWGGWFVAFLPVAIILFLLTPLLTYWIYPPEIKDCKKISAWIDEEYSKLGPMNKKEIAMMLISILALILWIGSKFFGIHPTTTALTILVLMLMFRVITWDEMLGNRPAWNVLLWFATLITMASGLKNVGFLAWLASEAGSYFQGLSPTWAVLGLLILFCVLRYFFASGTAYTTAMVALFATLLQHIPGVNPSEAMLILLLPMGLMGVLAPYATGHSPVWFASHYVKSSDFWRLGAIFGLIFLVIFILIDIPYIHYIYPYLSHF